MVISDATYPILRIFKSRCCFEKPNSDDKFFLTISPSKRVTRLLPTSISFAIKMLAIVDFPDPDKPVKNIVKPCEESSGLVRRISVKTFGKLNHFGILKSLSRRCSNSPLEIFVVMSTLSTVSSIG